MSDCKVSKFFLLLSVFEMTPFQPLHFISEHCDYCDITLLHYSTNNHQWTYLQWMLGNDAREIAEKGHRLSS